MTPLCMMVAMKRRDFLQTAGLAALGITPAIATKTGNRPEDRIHWKMVTGWTSVSDYAYLKARAVD